MEGFFSFQKQSQNLAQADKNVARFLECFGQGKTLYLPQQSQKSKSILEDGSRFFGIEKTSVFLQNNHKNLDMSYKTDLDLWDCFGQGKTFSFPNNPKNLDLSLKTDLDLWDDFGRKNLSHITEKIW